MFIGNVVSAGLLRQMEYDADRYEYGLVGSKTFGETCFELRMLGYSQGAALEQMLEHFRQGKLANDMIMYSDHLCRQLPYAVASNMQKAVREQRQSVFASHPTDNERIAKANEDASAGCFQLECPARDIIYQYEEVCQGVTWDFYRDQFNTLIPPESLTPTPVLLNLPSGTRS